MSNNVNSICYLSRHTLALLLLRLFSLFPRTLKIQAKILLLCALLLLSNSSCSPSTPSASSSPQQTIILKAGLSHSIARICNKVSSSMNFWGGECVYWGRRRCVISMSFFSFIFLQLSCGCLWLLSEYYTDVCGLYILFLLSVKCLGSPHAE